MIDICAAIIAQTLGARVHARPDLGMAAERKFLAAERWKILKVAVMTAKYDKPVLLHCNSASKRSFGSFGLLTTAAISPPCPTHPSASSGHWIQYSYTHTTREAASFAVNTAVKLLEPRVSLEAMMGFNNTGNVCVWPSEEVLAYYCLERRNLFQRAAVCELGSGMTGLAGLMLACTQTPSQVMLTDGNRVSVQNIRENVLVNQHHFGETVVSAAQLMWDSIDFGVFSSYFGTFDYVICADCLFFEDVHYDLVLVIRKLLKPNGRSQAIIFAPKRGKTLENFCNVAQLYFKVEQSMHYSDTVWRLHQMKIEDTKEYCPDLHYPLQIILTKNIK